MANPGNYRTDIENNYEYLDSSNIHHKNGEDFKWEDIVKILDIL